MYLYLGGALTIYKNRNEFYKANNWRKEIDKWAEDLDNVKTFNPAKDFLEEINHTYSDKLIVDQNEYYLNKCNIMICNLDEIDFSPGTIYELVRFKDMNKPVIAFGNKHWSPHINSCISHHCTGGTDKIIELLCNMFNQ